MTTTQSFAARTSRAATTCRARTGLAAYLPLALLLAICAAPARAAEAEAVASPEARLKELGIELAPADSPVANYVNAVRTGNLIFLAGKGPNLPGGGYVTGQVGTDLTIEQGYEASRLVGLAHLSVLRAELGSLDRVVRVVKVLGMVNAAPGFTQQPEVINGYSDLMVEVFGEKGKHARSAVGMGSLPRNIAVEVETIVEVAADQ